MHVDETDNVDLHLAGFVAVEEGRIAYNSI
jgi:hypothetical protein